jgi:hypothetical protein
VYACIELALSCLLMMDSQDAFIRDKDKRAVFPLQLPNCFCNRCDLQTPRQTCLRYENVNERQRNTILVCSSSVFCSALTLDMTLLSDDLLRLYLGLVWNWSVLVYVICYGELYIFVYLHISYMVTCPYLYSISLMVNCPSLYSRTVMVNCPSMYSRTVMVNCPSLYGRTVTVKYSSLYSRTVMVKCSYFYSRTVMVKCSSLYSRTVMVNCPSLYSRTFMVNCPSLYSRTVMVNSPSLYSRTFMVKCSSLYSRTVMIEASIRGVSFVVAVGTAAVTGWCRL